MLRIFYRDLFDRKFVDDKPITIGTKGGIVQAAVLDNGNFIRIEMG